MSEPIPTSCLVALCAMALFGVEIHAANPLMPDSFFADPEPHVWSDGNIYVYCSHDVGQKLYCSDNYHVVSSSNLVDWTDHGVAFTTKDLPPGSGKLLYACDCAFKDGKYFLYASTDNGTLAVATSYSPAGPFINGRRVGGLPEHPGIDPAVFIDDDGQAYLYWGQGNNVRAAKLKPDMLEIDPTTIMQPLTIADDHFHEGSAMIKRDGIYYYVYADESRGKRPTCLGYATGPAPFGPFTYRGVIIDNNGCDPGVWNNHGRIVVFKDRWYVFYHRSIGSGRRPRQFCAEPISFTTDGLVPEVKMTSQGVNTAIDVSQQTSAAIACQLSGTVRVQRDSDLVLAQIQNGDTATYRRISLTGNENIFVANYAIEQGSGGTIEVRLDNPSSNPVAELPIVAIDGTSGWRTSSIPLHTITSLHGSHDIFLSFQTDGRMSLRWIQFDFISTK